MADVYGFDESKNKVTLKSGAGITIGEDGTIGHENEMTASTTYIGGTTAVPMIKIDAQGHVVGLSKQTIYPPTTAGKAGQVWTSDGAGAGSWQEPAGGVDIEVRTGAISDSTTASLMLTEDVSLECTTSNNSLWYVPALSSVVTTDEFIEDSLCYDKDNDVVKRVKVPKVTANITGTGGYSLPYATSNNPTLPDALVQLVNEFLKGIQMSGPLMNNNGKILIGVMIGSNCVVSGYAKMDKNFYITGMESILRVNTASSGTLTLSAGTQSMKFVHSSSPLDKAYPIDGIPYEYVRFASYAGGSADIWEEVDLNNFPTDWVAGDRIKVAFYGFSLDASASTWKIGASITSVDPYTNHKLPYLEFELSSLSTTIRYSLCTFGNLENCVGFIDLNSIGRTSDWNSSSSSSAIFSFEALVFNQIGFKTSSVSVSRSDISNYVYKMYRLKQ